jgi:hypothetical protein
MLKDLSSLRNHSKELEKIRLQGSISRMVIVFSKHERKVEVFHRCGQVCFSQAWTKIAEEWVILYF